MTQRFEPGLEPASRALGSRPVALGCVRVGHDVWVVMGRHVRADERACDSVAGDGSRLRFCREVLADGRVRIAAADPQREASLLEFLGSW